MFTYAKSVIFPVHHQTCTWTLFFSTLVIFPMTMLELRRNFELFTTSSNYGAKANLLQPKSVQVCYFILRINDYSSIKSNNETTDKTIFIIIATTRQLSSHSTFLFWSKLSICWQASRRVTHPPAKRTKETFGSKAKITSEAHRIYRRCTFILLLWMAYTRTEAWDPTKSTSIT